MVAPLTDGKDTSMKPLGSDTGTAGVTEPGRGAGSRLPTPCPACGGPGDGCDRCPCFTISRLPSTPPWRCLLHTELKEKSFHTYHPSPSHEVQAYCESMKDAPPGPLSLQHCPSVSHRGATSHSNSPNVLLASEMGSIQRRSPLFTLARRCLVAPFGLVYLYGVWRGGPACPACPSTGLCRGLPDDPGGCRLPAHWPLKALGPRRPGAEAFPGRVSRAA